MHNAITEQTAEAEKVKTTKTIPKKLDPALFQELKNKTDKRQPKQGTPSEIIVPSSTSPALSTTTTICSATNPTVSIKAPPRPVPAAASLSIENPGIIAPPPRPKGNPSSTATPIIKPSAPPNDKKPSVRPRVAQNLEAPKTPDAETSRDQPNWGDHYETLPQSTHTEHINPPDHFLDNIDQETLLSLSGEQKPLLGAQPRKVTGTPRRLFINTLILAGLAITIMPAETVLAMFIGTLIQAAVQGDLKSWKAHPEQIGAGLQHADLGPWAGMIIGVFASGIMTYVLFNYLTACLQKSENPASTAKNTTNTSILFMSPDPTDQESTSEEEEQNYQVF